MIWNFWILIHDNILERSYYVIIDCYSILQVYKTWERGGRGVYCIINCFFLVSELELDISPIVLSDGYYWLHGGWWGDHKLPGNSSWWLQILRGHFPRRRPGHHLQNLPGDRCHLGAESRRRGRWGWLLLSVTSEFSRFAVTGVKLEVGHFGRKL